jgi:hypothetical protein
LPRVHTDIPATTDPAAPPPDVPSRPPALSREPSERAQPRQPPRGDGTAARPPDLDRVEPPPSLAAQVHGFVRRARAESGPETAQLGRRLLEADTPMLRVAGAAILGEEGVLDEQTLARVAADPSPAVTVNTLGWLEDTGHADLADALHNMLDPGRFDTDTLIDLLDSETLDSSGSRAALDLLSAGLSAEEAVVLYGEVASDAARDYAVRMKAALLLRDTMEFEDYRATIRNMRNTAAGDDPLWVEGVTRLDTRLQGPVEIQAGAVTVTPSDIDVMLAREHPMMVEDLAAWLEYAVDRTDSRIVEGTVQRLLGHIEELEKLPWTEEQQLALDRLHTAAEQLARLPAVPPDPADTPPPGP